MKKIYPSTQRSQEHNRKEYHSPTRFPKKEFELIYREKEHLPSSQAFESIIFMKSKKCQNKEGSKIAAKGKKHQVQNLKKVITKIEKQLKRENTVTHRKQEEQAKSCILKNKTNTASSNKKNTQDNYKNKSSQRLNKCQKGQNSSSDNIRKYKNIVSPVRNSKLKVSEQATTSSQFFKTTQDTSRKELKRSKGKKSKKQTENSYNQLFHAEQPEEYVFLENNFVELNPREMSVLEDKFSSKRDMISDKISSIYDYSRLRTINHNEEPFQQQTEAVFAHHLVYQSSKSSRNNNSFASFEEEQKQKETTENNFMAVQKYFLEKVTTIQNWWRRVLRKRKMQTIQSCEIEPIGKKDLFEVDTSKSIVFGDGSEENNENGSPIKMIDQLQGGVVELNHGEMQIIISRENAAKMQMQTHQEILQKLHKDMKITPQIYLERQEMIRSKYFKELQEIQELKRVLRNNANKAVEIEKKNQEDLKLLENTSIQVNNQLLDKLFGNQPEAVNKNLLSEIPILHGELIQRQKSTGCHFHSQQSSRTHLYKKQENSEEEYQEDFEDEEHKQGQLNEFMDTNGGEINSNIKELFDEFKIREDVKMQIDKRAAIQMGVIAEEIPAQIKDQFVRIDTSLSSIHRFILALFKYYIFYYKFDFLRLINMPYGYNIDKRMKIVQGYMEEHSPEEDDDGVIYGLEYVIPDEIFEEFYTKVYEGNQEQLTSAKKANFEYEKIHNRAIFDSFNEALNVFRPYFQINGPPFPWTSSEKALTFYFIAEENIQEVFEKTQFKVLKWGSTLCGLLVDKYTSTIPIMFENSTAEEIIQKSQQASHPLLNETREDRMGKNEKLEVQEDCFEWMIFEEEKAANLIETSQNVFMELVGEILAELRNKNEGTEIEGQLQHISVSSSLSEFQLC